MEIDTQQQTQQQTGVGSTLEEKYEDPITRIQLGLGNLGFLTSKMFNELIQSGVDVSNVNGNGSQQNLQQQQMQQKQTMMNNCQDIMNQQQRLHELFTHLPGANKTHAEQTQELKQLEIEDDLAIADLRNAVKEAEEFINSNLHNLRDSIARDLLQ